MKVRSQSVLPAVIMIIAIFAVITSAARMWQLASWNSMYREKFNTVFKDPDAVYDLADISKNKNRYLLADYEVISSPAIIVPSFTLEKALNYYDAPGGSVVLTLEPGDYLPAGYTLYTMNSYGERSLPTSVDGWRYARPFVPFVNSGDVADEGLYIKTDDLKAVNDIILGENDTTVNVTIGAASGHDGIAREMSSNEAEFLKNDIALYDNGIYRSPDLEVSLLEPRTVFTGVAGIVLIGWSIVIFAYNKRAEQKGKKV